MSQFNAPTYDIERPTGQCAFSGRKLEPGEPYIAALVELDPALVAGDKPASAAAALGFKRLDISQEAWQKGQRPERVFSFWRSLVPQPNARKKIFVDDEVLLNLFRRLADADQPQRLAFRFVLALILMRKRLLKYDGTDRKTTDAGQQEEWWRVIPKGEVEPLAVLNPQLGEAQIQQVTEQLSEVLEAEL